MEGKLILIIALISSLLTNFVLVGLALWAVNKWRKIKRNLIERLQDPKNAIKSIQDIIDIIKSL